MPFEKLTTAPAATDFTPLEEHQSQTPGTFFGAKAVLHLHSADTQLVVSQADLEGQSLFPDLRAASTASTNGTTANGESADTQIVISGLDVWVTSQNLLIFSPTTLTGVSLPYPDITLHAIQRLTLPGGTDATQGLYMQLALNASDFTPDDDLQTLEITLVPSSTSTPTIANLFAAVSACADLNPDPADSDSEAEGGDDDIQIGGVGGGLPGAGGWITSDNIHEHVDAEGNFVGFGGGALGAGAGTVRAREEDEANDENADEEVGQDGQGGAAAGAGGEEAKWRRTE